jgi:hypothetical protein
MKKRKNSNLIKCNKQTMKVLIICYQMSKLMKNIHKVKKNKRLIRINKN